MRRMPNLKALQAFRHAGEQLSFKAAAERLNVTQAAISQQIKALENQLGTKLFHRMTREVALTAEGKQLLSAVSQGFATLEQGVAQLMVDPNPGQLNISTLPSFASRWLVPRLGRFQQAAPELTVSLSPSLSLASFDGQNLDVAVRFGEGDYPGLKTVKLFEEYLVPVCHPSLLDTRRPLEAQLPELALLTDDAPDMVSVWEEFEGQSGIPLRHESARLHVTDSNMLVEAVLAGQGLSLLRFSLIHELLALGQLVCPLPLWLKSRYDYYLAAPPAHFKRPKIRRFEQWLRSEFATSQEAWQAFQEAFK
ncbi:LysR substrate-binding domain-containing protein [Motiliproteus sp. SC1-56]|uniref:LysR substrate-binding domain-containing protein n=1 Tax=Motiliproteus sp. SC1-56 TaxID=2799565 RepID=UPI001A9032A3|nr:LysR substrate-binding domain-containing protein [Motiliproteus sp. SC1-56]